VPRSSASLKRLDRGLSIRRALPANHGRNGCFQEREQTSEASRPFATVSAASRAKNSGRRIRKPIAAGNRRNRDFQRVSAAITRRASAAVRGHQRRRFFADASPRAFAVAMGKRFDFRDFSASTTCERSFMPLEILSAISGCFSRSCHCAVAVEGRIASDTSTSRPCGAGARIIPTSLRLMPKPLQQRVHRELRMVRCGHGGEFPLAVQNACRFPCHASSSRSVSSPGSTTAPWRQRCYRVKEFRGRRHRAGRAGGDHRSIMMRGETRGFPPRSAGSRRAGRLDPCRSPRDDPARAFARSSGIRASTCQYWSS